MELNCCDPFNHFNEQKDMTFLICCFFLTVMAWGLVSILVIKPQTILNQNIENQGQIIMATNKKFVLDMTVSKYLNESVINLPIEDGFLDIQGCQVFYRRAVVPSDIKSKPISILFLHGRSFTSANWQNIHTLSLMAGNGYSSFAIDLPKYGKTTGNMEGDKVEFINQVIKKLKISNPILVSPSMSGEYSIQILKKNPELVNGLVAVAPVKVALITKENYKKIQTPTLIVYGTKDNSGLAEVSKEYLKYLPNHFEFPIMNAGHAAYLDQPKIFHQALYSFLTLLTSFNHS